jgi:type I restriction enzyme S subunit
VAAKERVLELLAEKRRALITRAVTRGLDPSASLRESGIPWLGKIPAHWDVERARWLFRERDERSVTGEEEMLTVSHLTGVTPRSEKDVNMFEAETNEDYKICHTGDLVINTLWAWMGAMGVTNVKGIVSPAYHVYQPDPRLEPAYIDALVRMPVFAQEVTRYSKGVWSSRLRLYPEGFFEVFLPVPPIEEQRAIVAHIAKETAKLDALHSATESTILLLKERRAAFIAAAVTGLIDVVGT